METGSHARKGVIEQIDRMPSAQAVADADIARIAESMLRRTYGMSKDSVKVRVERGWLTLTGEVEGSYQRYAAAAAMRGLTGVIGVSDQLSVRHQLPLCIAKADLEAALRRRMAADGRKICVAVRGTEVTLTGLVPGLSERDMACVTAWGAPGVESVVDHMTIGY